MTDEDGAAAPGRSNEAAQHFLGAVHNFGSVNQQAGGVQINFSIMQNFAAAATQESVPRDTPVLLSVTARQKLEYLTQCISQWTDGVEIGQVPEGLRRRILTQFEDLLVLAGKGEHIGSADAEQLPAALEDLWRRLVIKLPEAVSLGRGVAEVFNGIGDYPRALEVVRRVVQHRGVPTSDDLLTIGVIQMDLSRIEDSAHIFEIALSGVDRDNYIVYPSDPYRRAEQAYSLRQFRELWLPGYHGHARQVIRAARRLRRYGDATGMPRHLVGAIYHQLGWAYLELGIRSRNRRQVEAASIAFKEAERRAGDSVNPHAHIAQYRAMSVFESGRTVNNLWSKTDESFVGWSEPFQAHKYFNTGLRLSKIGQTYSALDQFEQALALWSAHPYPKGSADALLEIAKCYADLGDLFSLRNSFKAVLAAENIVESMKLGRPTGLVPLRQSLADRLGATASDQEHLLELARADLPKLFAARTE